MTKVDVLDHGFVRLVDSMGDDMSIVRAARVSYNAAPRGNDDTALIRYLMLNKHTSPFESVALTFEVKAPIFVFRQWHRHRTWSYNEVSARYTELPEEYYLPEPEQITMQSSDNKQMRTDEQHEDADLFRIYLEKACKDSHAIYRVLVKNGCPRELARSVLPMGTYSRMFATVNLHNLFHFLRLRLHDHAQYEIRIYAQAILHLLANVCPVATKAFEETL